MKIGILGGGQLGRMFLQAAINYPAQTKVLDPQANAACAHLCDEFVVGDFADEETVYQFGQDCDAIGIEIEHVNVNALKRLQAEGKHVVPSPEVLMMIQDKGLQKQFYHQYGIPTAPFYLIDGKHQLDLARIPLPFVQKTRIGGYDGKGVQVIKTEAELENLWDVPSVIEALCPIEKEIAVVVVNGVQEQVQYPTVEMVFNPVLNLVDIVQLPAEIDDKIQAQVERICRQLSEAFQSVGLFAIEMFVSTQGEVWVNETACRVHNSGHLTIEACYSSQFDQMWRLLAKQPLGNPKSHHAAAMVNLIGGEGENGRAVLTSLSDLLAQPDVFVHWYGKTEVRAGRKMGHITLTANDLTTLKHRLTNIQQSMSLTVSAEK